MKQEHDVVQDTFEYVSAYSSIEIFWQRPMQYFTDHIGLAEKNVHFYGLDLK